MITPPLLLVENGDLVLFRSATDLQRYVEPIDVVAGVYEVFDAKGLSLVLTVEKRPASGLLRLFKVGIDEVVLKEKVGVPTDPPKVQEIVRSFLVTTGDNEAELQMLALDQMIGRAVARLGYAR